MLFPQGRLQVLPMSVSFHQWRLPKQDTDPQHSLYLSSKKRWCQCNYWCIRWVTCCQRIISTGVAKFLSVIFICISLSYIMEQKTNQRSRSNFYRYVIRNPKSVRTERTERQRTKEIPKSHIHLSTINGYVGTDSFLKNKAQNVLAFYNQDVQLHRCW